MADKDKLRDMLDAFIDDNDEKAQVDFHSYVTDKMKDTLGLASEESDDEVELDDE